MSDALLDQVSAARAALPTLGVADDVLAAHVARHAGADDVDALAVGDLVLACACAEGDAAALAHFDATYRPDIVGALSRLRADRDFVDEVIQRVREKLFVGPQPKILDYAGRGTLRAWLKAVVMRTALNARRRKATEPPPGHDEDRLLEVAGPALEPELAMIVAKYGDDYKRAVHAALGSLSAEDRNVLRLSLLEGLGIDAIARIYAVHRATVARWVSRTRETVASEARRLLGESTRLPPSELASVTQACRATLDLSLVRALEKP